MARKWLIIGGVALALALAAPIAWYLLGPLFVDNTVNDNFPAVAAAPLPAPIGTATSIPTAAPTIAPPPPTPTVPPAPTPTVATPPATAIAVLAPPAIPVNTPIPAPTATTPPPPTTTPLPPTTTPAPPAPVPTGPVALRSGRFHDVVHEGSGTATIYRLPDGRMVLRLEDFDVLNGPDLYLYLSALPDSNESGVVLANRYVSLGRLKGNRGNQTYDLPANVNLAEINSIVIWCQQFRVNFATAPIK